MTKKGLEFLQNCKTYDGQPVKERLDELLADKSTRFWFGTEWYTMTKGLHIIAGYKNKETGKGCDLGPWERDYIAEALYPDTQRIIDAHNEAHKAKTSAKWREFLELLPDAKIEAGLRDILNTMGELALVIATYDEQHANE